MKKLVLPCLIPLIFLAATLKVTAADINGFDSTIRILQEQVSRQIERIKAAREKANSQMSLAGIRIAEQLKRSSDDLAVQIEVMERLREKLQETTSETDQKINLWKEQSGQLLGTALSDIATQISQTNDLIQRLETVKSQVSTGDCKTASDTIVKQSSLPLPAVSEGQSSLPDPETPQATFPVASLPPPDEPSLPIAPASG
ncbi:MAG: hypothetical protein WCJ75_11810 [Desulfomonile sp.]